MVVFSVRRRRDIDRGRSRPSSDPMALTVPHGGVRCRLTSRRDVGDHRLEEMLEVVRSSQRGWYSDKPTDNRQNRKDRERNPHHRR